MGSFQDAMVRALPGIIGSAVSLLGSSMIDAASPPKDSKQLFEEYYRAVEESNLPQTVAEADQILTGRARMPAAPSVTAGVSHAAPAGAYNAAGRSDMAVMTDNISTAINSLRVAKDHTRCSLCRATLTELETEVQEKTEFIRQSSRLWTAMQDMKAQGAIPESVAWSDLSDDQKNQVKAYADNQ
jgi:hypothetical protein